MQGTKFELSKELLDSLTNRLTDEEIALQYGVARSTIYQLRRRLGVLSMYVKSNSRKNRSTGAVLPSGHGVPSGALASLRADYFSRIDSEQKAYFLGLLVADGSIQDSPRNCCVTIELQTPDCDVLQELAKELNSNKEVRVYQRQGKKDSGRLRIYSRQLVSDLLAKGMRLDTEKVEATQEVPIEFRRHFVRGVIDGDGHINGRKKALYLGSCSLALCESVTAWVREAVPNPAIKLTHRKLPSGKTFYRVNFTSASPVVDWLYSDCSVAIERKNVQAAIWLSRFSAGALVSPLPPVLGSGVSR